MALMCVARFGRSPQEALIDAAWSTTVQSASGAPTCALLAMDGSLRLAAAGSPQKGALLDTADDMPPFGSADYTPSSLFEFGSPFSVESTKQGNLAVHSHGRYIL